MNNNFETKRNQFFIERLKKRTKWVVTCLQAMNNQNLKKPKAPISTFNQSIDNVKN